MVDMPQRLRPADEPLRTAAEERLLCADLLARVAAIGDRLRATTAESESLQHLSPTSLTLLKEHRLLSMRLMEEMGGLEASIATQCKVLAALAEVDSATAWCSMVHNNGVGTLAAYFPESCVTEIFRSGVPVVSFVAAPTGAARRIPGGYSISGRWRFCSGFNNAEWIVCGARVADDSKDELLLVVSRNDVTRIDTWNVSGLRGTGSVDFTLDDYFIAEDRTIHNASRVQLRGSRVYGRPGILIGIYEHAAFAWGAGRRALRLLGEQVRALGDGLAQRELVAAEIGRLSVALEAAAVLMLEYYTTLETLTTEQSADPVIASHGRAIAVHITDVAVACADAAFRRAGTRAAFLPNEIEMVLRDIKTAQAHVLVSDAAYGAYGTALVSAPAAPIPTLKAV